jgi:2-haloalkanoic acid dehalogenase type II
MSSDERTGVLPAVCVFDAYGTLFDLASATRRHLDALGDRAAPLADLWRAKQLEYTWLRSLMDDAWVPFEQVVADALDHAMEALALDQPATRDALLAAFRQLETYPEVPGVLTKLRGAGIRTAVLSNGSRGMLDAAVESAGLAPLLDAVLSVDDPVSRVRIRITCSRADTKILPSPILPVSAALTMASTAPSTWLSPTAISSFSLGRKSTTYSAPR